MTHTETESYLARMYHRADEEARREGYTDALDRRARESTRCVPESARCLYCGQAGGHTTQEHLNSSGRDHA